MGARLLKIYMGIPTMGSMVDSQAYALRDLEDTYKEHVKLVYPAVCVRRMFHDFARNSIVEEFLASDCDILWFLDSDITPSKDILDLVTMHGDKWKVAGAAYPVFMCPPGSDNPEVMFTTYIKSPESGNLTLGNCPKTGTEFIDGLATGCLFIKREVFASLSKPYFEFKYDKDTRNMVEGEDLGFCRKLADLGIKFFIDHGMVAKHQKNIDLLDMNNYAISYSNRSVMQYDAMIKDQIQEAIKAAYLSGYKKGLESQTATQTGTLWTPNKSLAKEAGKTLITHI